MVKKKLYSSVFAVYRFWNLYIMFTVYYFGIIVIWNWLLNFNTCIYDANCPLYFRQFLHSTCHMCSMVSTKYLPFIFGLPPLPVLRPKAIGITRHPSAHRPSVPKVQRNLFNRIASNSAYIIYMTISPDHLFFRRWSRFGFIHGFEVSGLYRDRDFPC